MPIVGFLGQALPINLTDQEVGLEYRVNSLEPGGTWVTPAFSTNPSITLTIDTIGWHHIGSTSRDATTLQVVENLYHFAFYTYDQAQALAVLEGHDGRLNIKMYDSGVSMQAAQSGWRAGITSWGSFADYVNAQFSAAAPVDATFTPDQARVAYFVQWVSGLWSYGNLNNISLAGCVVTNEITGPIDPSMVTVRTFMDSPIGCCTDYTTVLSYLLIDAGLENRVIAGAGHVFNEVKIDGVWWTVDANLGLMYRGTWEQVLDLNQTIDIIRFDHAGMTLGSPVYRETLVEFYNILTQQLEFGQFESANRRDPLTFFDSLAYGDTFLNEIDTVQWSGAGTSWSGHDIAPYGYGWAIGDFNGDGKDDGLRQVTATTGALVSLSDGAQLATSQTWSTSVASTTPWLVGDFNGDGKDDILGTKTGVSEAFVHLSTGSAFATGTSWTVDADGDFGWWAGDFDGDGKDDIFRMVNGLSGAEVFLSTGTSFVSAGHWTSFGSGSHEWYVGDYNGDGKDDIARYTAGLNTEVLFSTGTAFELSTMATTASLEPDNPWYVADFNSDGRSDLGRYVSGIGFEYLAANATSTGFDAPVFLSSMSINGRTITVGDFAGDGASELFGWNRIFNNGALEFITENPDLEGLTVADVNRLVSFTKARLHASNVDSTIGKQAAKQDWRPASLDTLDELHATLGQIYDTVAYSAELAHWSPAVGRAIFAAQWIGGMWSLGDKPGAAADESVRTNAVTGTIAALQTSARHYIAAAVGAQADSAALLASMFVHDEIETHVITTGEYTLVEANIGGDWWTFSPSLAVALRGRWETIINTGYDPEVYIFDTPTMRAGSATYDPDATRMQNNFLSLTGSGLLYQFVREDAATWIGAHADANVFANFLAGNGYADTRTGTASANNLVGSGGHDKLFGLDGNDTLNGAVGNDSLVGGLGNDIYYVDSVSDVVVEAVGEGSDAVFTTLTYTLGAMSHIETLRTTNQNGFDAIHLYGNGFANLLLGNAAGNILSGADGADSLSGYGGNDTINGGTGADRLTGGAGNDFYYVDTSADLVFESVGEGTDTIFTTLSYSLNATSEVEILRVASPTTVTAVNLTGNALANTLIGNGGSNRLLGGAANDVLYGLDGNDTVDGGAGVDRMIGGKGNDTYYVDTTADLVTELVGEGVDTLYSTVSYSLGATVDVEVLRATDPAATSLSLTGNALANTIIGSGGTNTLSGGDGDDALSGLSGNDSLIGGNGADRLVGGLGNDTMTGGAGADRFYFDTAAATPGNVDVIMDFSAGSDSVWLSRSVYAGFAATGLLATDAFAVGTEATTAAHRIVYDTTTGAVIYDADGSGVGNAVQVAMLGSGLALTASTFWLY